MRRVRDTSDGSPSDQAIPPSTSTSTTSPALADARARHREALAAGRARRRASRSQTPGALPNPTPAGPGLGTPWKLQPAQVTAPGGVGRDARFERRDQHQRVSLGKTFTGCGKKLFAGAAALAAGADGAHFAGVVTCGMVHMCTWCGARILSARAEYAQDAAEAWTAAGGGIVMTAHTLRHYRRQRYGTLRKRERGGLVAVLHDAWSGAYGHRSGKMWQRAKHDHLVVGVLRAFEDTWGDDTGFHLHFHAMWFTARPLAEDELAAFADVLSARWARSVTAAGGHAVSTSCDRPDCSCGGRGHGVRVDAVPMDEAGAVGRYLFKDGDHATLEPAIGGVGAELALGGEKSGRGARRLGPFELGDLAATGDAEAVRAWQEREYGVHGVRKMYLSNGMKSRLAELGVTDDRTDEEIAADEGQEQREPIALLPRDTWYQHVMPVRGRRLELLRAAEAGGVEAVRTLVESWGLVWGRDVLPPPPLE